jgi:hypothetical protein
MAKAVSFHIPFNSVFTIHPTLWPKLLEARTLKLIQNLKKYVNKLT